MWWLDTGFATALSRAIMTSARLGRVEDQFGRP